LEPAEYGLRHELVVRFDLIINVLVFVVLNVVVVRHVHEEPCEHGDSDVDYDDGYFKDFVSLLHLGGDLDALKSKRHDPGNAEVLKCKQPDRHAEARVVDCQGHRADRHPHGVLRVNPQLHQLIQRNLIDNAEKTCTHEEDDQSHEELVLGSFLHSCERDAVKDK